MAGGAHPYDELFLFHAPDIHGPWTPHPCNPVVSDARHARPAGVPFRWGDSLLRPAQDCAARYGDRISVREITVLTETDYQEREVAEIKPQWAKGLFANHTLNIVDDLTVIDGRKLRSRGDHSVCRGFPLGHRCRQDARRFNVTIACDVAEGAGAAVTER
jgi:hypothetical protein